MVKNKLNLRQRKIFSRHADRLADMYYYMMLNDDEMAKAQESSFMRYINDSVQTKQFANLNQPLKLKKGK